MWSIGVPLLRLASLAGCMCTWWCSSGRSKTEAAAHLPLKASIPKSTPAITWARVLVGKTHNRASMAFSVSSKRSLGLWSMKVGTSASPGTTCRRGAAKMVRPHTGYKGSGQRLFGSITSWTMPLMKNTSFWPAMVSKPARGTWMHAKHGLKRRLRKLRLRLQWNGSAPIHHFISFSQLCQLCQLGWSTSRLTCWDILFSLCLVHPLQGRRNTPRASSTTRLSWRWAAARSSLRRWLNSSEGCTMPSSLVMSMTLTSWFRTRRRFRASMTAALNSQPRREGLASIPSICSKFPQWSPRLLGGQWLAQ